MVTVDGRCIENKRLSRIFAVHKYVAPSGLHLVHIVLKDVLYWFESDRRWNVILFIYFLSGPKCENLSLRVSMSPWTPFRVRSAQKAGV